MTRSTLRISRPRWRLFDAARHGGRLSASVAFLTFSWLSLIGVGCSTDGPLDPTFQVERTLVQVVAELKAAEDADTYRFDPPRDASGENLYRASIARLQRMEALGVDPAAQPSLSFALGLSFLGLGRYDEAAARFDAVARRDGALGLRARANAEWARTMATLVTPIEETDSARVFLLALQARRNQFLELLPGGASTLVPSPSGSEPDAVGRRSAVEAEIERLDVRTREWHWRYRVLVGTSKALALARDVAETHVDSRRVLEHLLRLGDMYSELASTVLAQGDPAGRAFDPVLLRRYVQAAMAVYAEVAAIDGRPEREEARAKMIALESKLDRASST